MFTKPAQHTQSPIVTGTTVLGVKYKDGILLMADTQASYGKLSRYRDEKRLLPLTSKCVLGATGDFGDFQHVSQSLESLLTLEAEYQDGHELNAKQLYTYLSQVMYARRSKINPLWNQFVLGGLLEDGEPFLGYVDLRGTTYQASTIATGFGAYVAQPLLRKAIEGREAEITEAEATQVMENCMRILYYRDCLALNKFQRAKITCEGVEISEPYSISTEWRFAEGVRGYGAQVV